MAMLKIAPNKHGAPRRVASKSGKVSQHKKVGNILLRCRRKLVQDYLIKDEVTPRDEVAGTHVISPG